MAYARHKIEARGAGFVLSVSRAGWLGEYDTVSVHDTFDQALDAVLAARRGAEVGAYFLGEQKFTSIGTYRQALGLAAPDPAVPPVDDPPHEVPAPIGEVADPEAPALALPAAARVSALGGAPRRGVGSGGSFIALSKRGKAAVVAQAQAPEAAASQ